MENYQTFVLLKTKAGDYLETVGEDLIIGGKTPSPKGVFQLIQARDEMVALKSLCAKKYVALSGDRIKVDSFGIGPESTMGSIAPDKGMTVFMAPNGKFWGSEGGEAQFAANCENHGAGEVFVIESAGEDLIRVNWGDIIHQKLFSDACEVIKHLKDRIPGAPELLNFLTAYEPHIRRGIHDADYKTPYWDKFSRLIEQGLYRNHFYDPVTEKNFWGDPYYTAKNMTLDLLDIARRYEDKINKAYNLGLAFHFISDLTVPVHTANYITFPPFWNHSHYEEQADREYDQFRGNLNALDVADVLPQYGLEEFLRNQVAAFSYLVYNKYLRGRELENWPPELIRATFPDLFGAGSRCYAPRSTTTFLLYCRNI